MKRYGVVLALAGLGMLVNAGDAAACGGCFAPPSTVQVVTDHRMVLSVSPTQTTLWDQFQYSGSPGEFSWILPIRYSDAVRVQIADNAFLQFADDVTAPVVTPPRRPFPPGCYNMAVPGASGGGVDAADAGVVVHLEEVVGPYAVAIIGGTDPMAIRNWLSSNGYTVPAAVSPVIDFYTAMHMDYVALRLRPGEGISRMSPVRVTLPGYVPTLPLRMISAGVADKVGLSLIVVAPSRMETQNFPNGVITADDLTYDFSNPTNPATDYLNAFESHNRASGGRLWLTESATSQGRLDWAARVRGYSGPGGPVRVDAGTVGDAGAVSDPVDDVNTAFAGLGDRATVTRLRADLNASALDRDLALSASDLGLLSNQYRYGHTLNVPTFPPCPDAGTVSPGTDSGIGDTVDAGVTPVDDGGTGAGTGAGSGTLATGGVHCTAAPWNARSGRHGGGTALALLAGAAVAVAVRRRRGA